MVNMGAQVSEAVISFPLGFISRKETAQSYGRSIFNFPRILPSLGSHSEPHTDSPFLHTLQHLSIVFQVIAILLWGAF